MKRFKKVISVLLCGALALSLCACGSSSSSSDSESSTGSAASSDSSSSSGSKSVTIMSENDLMSLDSGITTDGTSFEVINAFTDGLYGYAEDGTLELAMAESVDISDDGLTYTFTIRDATWSNGEAVTADDFVYAWKRVITESSEYAFLLGAQGANIVGAEDAYTGGGSVDDMGVTATDEKTLVVELASPCGFFDKLLAFPTFFPINEEFCEEQGDQYATSTDAVLSCGAFILDTWELGTKVVLTKNEDYWDADTVQIDELTINLSQEQSAAALQFDSGELDYCIISSSLVDTYSDTDEYSTINNGFLWYLFVNFENEYLQNENIRKGLSAAIDRVDLCDNILKDGSTPAVGFVPTELSTNSDGSDFAESCGDLLAAYEIDYNLEKAQEYIDAGLAELGVDSIDISMVYGTDEGVDTTATYLQQAFSNLEGINFSLVATEKQSRINVYLKDGDFDICLTRWGPDYSDSTTYLNNLEKSQWTSNNYGHYYNEEYDALMESARNETDAAAREAILQQANELLMEDVAIIPIFQQGQAVLTSSGLSGVLHNAAGTPYIYKYLTKE
ncbi:MAG: peptide ABC transporter substrate-binding protein [Clostridiales bacterium]|nr:peptide ABC transporter substrate-binding protein [Clostridiales bacterium]